MAYLQWLLWCVATTNQPDTPLLFNPLNTSFSYTSQEIFYLWRPLLRDQGDDHVLEVAVAAGVDYLVTYNLSDFAGAETVGIKLATPRELLTMMETKQ